MNPRLICRSFPLLFVLALLAGCASSGSSGATAPGSIKPASKPTPETAATSLLAYFGALHGLSSAELARATEQARKRYLAEKSIDRQLQYALVLSLPGGDMQRAQQLLEPLLKENAVNPELRALAELLSVNLAERQRLSENLQAETRRADALEHQLEALKNVEKQMLERDVPALSKP